MESVQLVVWLVVGTVVSLAGAVGMWRRAHRRATAESIAARAGLEYSYEDPFDCTRVRFALFTRGDGRGAENVMWSGSGDPTLRAFDYWFYDEHQGQNGQTTKSYRHFTCATALTGGSWPSLTIQREGLLEKVTDGLTGIDIDFESDEFNRTFAVFCPDRRFASTMVDPRMMEFLLETKGELNFELKGRWLLVWAKRVPADLMPGLLRVAAGFVDRIPKVVWDLYPSDFADDDGNALPSGDEFRLLYNLMRHERDHSDDPFDVLTQSPFEALEDDTRPEYDLDGNVIVPKPENPWGQ